MAGARKRVAVVGSGVSGLVTAWLLRDAHDVTLFEADSRLGGHTNTVPVTLGGRTWPVDTGFIVFNVWTYPRFIRLLRVLGVESRPTRMSFGVRDEQTGLEYSATSLSALFAQPENLLRPRHYRFIAEILRFLRAAPRLLESREGDPSLGEWLRREGYSQSFVDQFVVPMGAAIWSADRRVMHEFPARFFVRFYVQHGMLAVFEQPEWRTVVGGSMRYAERLVATLGGRVRASTPVARVRRHATHVEVTPAGAPAERFDEVVIATHSDQALRLLTDATAAEKRVLGAIRYQENEAVLHTDVKLMPRSRKAWAAWNYHVLEREGPVPVTYDMNALQGFDDAPERFLVTLNRSDRVAPSKVIERITYHHPVFTPEAVRAQADYELVGGVNRTHYAGAYWYYGFHEDGVRSASRVARTFGVLGP